MSNKQKTCSDHCSTINRKLTKSDFHKTWRTRNKDKLREYHRNWSLSNKDKVSAYAKKYLAKAKEENSDSYKRRLVYASNRARIRIAENPDKHREYCRTSRNRKSAAASMLEACATMIHINERGIHDETE